MFLKMFTKNLILKMFLQDVLKKTELFENQL